MADTTPAAARLEGGGWPGFSFGKVNMTAFGRPDKLFITARRSAVSLRKKEARSLFRSHFGLSKNLAPALAGFGMLMPYLCI